MEDRTLSGEKNNVIKSSDSPKILKFDKIERSSDENEGREYMPKPLFGDEQRKIIKDFTPKTLGDMSVSNRVAVILKDAVVRKRIEISLDELRLMYSNEQEDVLKRAQSIIATFNFDDNRDEKFMKFGLALQQKYTDEIRDICNVAKDGVIEEIKMEINDIAKLLQEMDCTRIFEENRGFFGLFDKNKEVLKAEYSRKYEIVEKKSAIVKSKLPKILEIKERTDIFASKISSMTEEMNAVVIAGTFLFNYGNELLKSKSSSETKKRYEYVKLETAVSSFGKRIESIAITRSSLLQGIAQTKIFRETVFNLINVIQDVLMTSVSLWWGRYLNASLLADSKKSSAANESQSLLLLQEQIIKKLKMEGE